MKVARHHDGHSSRRRKGAAARGVAPALSSREKHYLVWGILRLTLGILQMTFAAVAIVHLIFNGLTSATLAYGGVAAIATLVSRLLYRGRKGPHR
ncbi:hypothetical protein OKW42_006549 [Paraburkholderia sp. WC7.3d]